MTVTEAAGGERVWLNNDYFQSHRPINVRLYHGTQIINQVSILAGYLLLPQPILCLESPRLLLLRPSSLNQ